MHPRLFGYLSILGCIDLTSMPLSRNRSSSLVEVSRKSSHWFKFQFTKIISLRKSTIWSIFQKKSLQIYFNLLVKFYSLFHFLKFSYAMTSHDTRGSHHIDQSTKGMVSLFSGITIDPEEMTRQNFRLDKSLLIICI